MYNIKLTHKDYEEISQYEERLNWSNMNRQWIDKMLKKLFKDKRFDGLYYFRGFYWIFKRGKLISKQTPEEINANIT